MDYTGCNLVRWIIRTYEYVHRGRVQAPSWHGMKEKMWKQAPQEQMQAHSPIITKTERHGNLSGGLKKAWAKRGGLTGKNSGRTWCCTLLWGRRRREWTASHRKRKEGETVQCLQEAWTQCTLQQLYMSFDKSFTFLESKGNSCQSWLFHFLKN